MAQVVTILLPDNNPSGVKIIELANFNGKVFIIPRGKLREIQNRQEANQPAIYYLLGKRVEELKQLIYIGQSERFFQRLSNHDTNKDFWDIAIVFTGNNLNSADVRYLENKSVNYAKKINRYEIQNSVEPLENNLTEAQKAIADEVFEKIKFILTFLDIPVFQDAPRVENSEIYYLKVKDADAQGSLLENDEFIVYAGSKARTVETEAFKGTFSSRLREEFVNKNIFELTENKKHYLLKENYIFTSPSAAASAMAGNPYNGWTAWKNVSGKTLDEKRN